MVTRRAGLVLHADDMGVDSFLLTCRRQKCVPAVQHLIVPELTSVSTQTLVSQLKKESTVIFGVATSSGKGSVTDKELSTTACSRL